MNKGKTIAQKTTWLVCGTTVLLALVASYIALGAKYRISEQHHVAATERLVANINHQLQPAIYYQDNTALSGLLDILFSNSSLKYAAVYDSQSNLLMDRAGNNAQPYDQTVFSILRKQQNPFARILDSRIDFSAGGRVIDLIIPVVSPVSPTTRDLVRASFLAVLAEPKGSGSSHLMGYVHLGLDATVLSNDFLIFAKYWGAACLVLVLTILAFTLITTRRITEPLTRLATMAEDISLGKLDPIVLTGSAEARQIASSLNIIIDSLASHKTDIEMNNRLLSLKVDERTVELSARNKELNQAIAEVTLAKNRLRQAAYFDSLTNLPNRRHFNEKAQLLLDVAKREGHILAILFVDIDNFKRINDSLGHTAGDLLLNKVASRLSVAIRQVDLLAIGVTDSTFLSRLGGDEFTIVLNKIDSPESACVVAERLLARLATPITIEDHEFVITPSIGIALFPKDGDSLETLLKHADTAMYNIKEAGKNGYLLYSENMAEADIARLNLETDLRKAIDSDELELYFQPQVNAVTGEIDGAEVLLRWHHRELGYIPPNEFVTLAEEAGFMARLGDWVLVHACKYMKSIQDRGLKLANISINVSSLQFTNNFSTRLLEVLDKEGLNAKALTIEITEGVIMGNAQETISRLGDLKRVGVRISVDDFGTGYSSLSYLSRFPLDELKIDRCFVENVDKSPHNASIVGAIISMGQSLGFSLVAEGVETPGEYAFLRQRGVKVIQGYLFSKPVNHFEFEALLKHHLFREKIHALSMEPELEPELAENRG